MKINEVVSKYSLDKINDHVWHIQGCSGKTGDGLENGLSWLSEQIVNIKENKFKNNPYVKNTESSQTNQTSNQNQNNVWYSNPNNSSNLTYLSNNSTNNNNQLTINNSNSVKSASKAVNNYNEVDTTSTNNKLSSKVDDSSDIKVEI